MRDVPVAEIRAQDHVLTVPRYLQTQAAAVLAAVLERHEIRPLGEVVEIVRPKALPKAEDGGNHMHEASPGDIGKEGCLAWPPQAIRLARGGTRMARNRRVGPGDVLLLIKGTIGRVGLVPRDAPQTEDGFWTVSQSLVILRAGAHRARGALRTPVERCDAGLPRLACRRHRNQVDHGEGSRRSSDPERG